MRRRRWRRTVLPCARPMASSTKTSKAPRGLVLEWPHRRRGLEGVGTGGHTGAGKGSGIASGWGLVSARASSRWGGGHPHSAAWLARSTAVSVAAQKYGGDSVHPIGRTKGKATNGSVSGSVGNTTPSLGMSAVFNHTR